MIVAEVVERHDSQIESMENAHGDRGNAKDGAQD